MIRELFLRAVALHQQGQLIAAQKLYGQILDVEPVHGDALNLLGVVYTQQEEWAKAEAVLVKAIDLYPKCGRYHNSLGNLFRACGRHQEAAKAWREAVDNDPTDADCWCNLGVAALEQGDESQAEIAWRRAIEVSPSHDSALWFLGVMFHQRGDHDEAAIMYDSLLCRRPDHREARGALADIRRLTGADALARGEIQQAKTWLAQATELDPGDLNGWVLFSTALQRNGLFRQAFEACQNALKLDSSRPEIHHNIRNLLKETGQRDQAIAAYRRALELGGTHPATQLALDALTGSQPEATPREVVRDLFDQYSTRFEEHLTRTLGYSTPSRLRNMFDDMEGSSINRFLDLGCGTGLGAEAFCGLGAEMTGVDLSPKMIEVASSKNIYTNLFTDEIVTFLRATTQQWDVVLAADVLVYLGDLREFMMAIRPCVVPGGHLLLSVERSLEEPFVFLESERFAHSSSYIHEQLAQIGFAVRSEQTIKLRQDGQGWIKGILFCARSEK